MSRLAALCLVPAGLALAQVPSPVEHFGHRMGVDRKLVEWDAVVSYYAKLAQASDRVRMDELGPTTEGRPFVLVTVADPATLRRLNYYRDIQGRLVDPRRTPPAAAEQFIAQGKAVVLITCSIHSTEVASTMTAMEFVHDLIAADTPKKREILRETILLLVPSLNPDGIDKVAEWYRRWLGTPYEGAPMIELYHKYLGHDNNRDWYIFSQPETRLTVERVHNVWRPQIVYDVHEMGSTGARIFVPPWIDPIDPNIDPLLVQQANAFGTRMAVDLTSAGKKGVVVNGIYDYFTPARHYQSYHGGIRLLSESAGISYAGPIQTPFSALQTRARGYNAQVSSWNFLEPWPGGEWKLRDIVDYQLIAFESVLYSAALRRADLLRNFYRVSRRVLARESPSHFVVPRRQHDPNALTRLLETLEFGSVEIQRSTEDFRVGGRRFDAGDYVIDMKQPFASFAKTLLERQNYPDLREYPEGPPKRPYDATAHCLPLLMGVDAEPVDGVIRARLEPAPKIAPWRGRVDQALALRLSPSWSNAWIAVNRLLKSGADVYRDEAGGEFYFAASEAPRERLTALAEELGIDFRATAESPLSHRRLRLPRVGLYSGHVPIIDEGWTRWLLERYEFPYVRLDNSRVARGNLISDFDVVILPDAEPQTLHAGYIEGASYQGAAVPPQYAGGIGDRGAEALRRFAEQGGVVMAFNKASRYALEHLNLAGIEDAAANVSERRFYSPGSLLYADVEGENPLCFGLRPREAVWFESGPVFRIAGSTNGAPNPRALLRYPASGVRASGWLLGEEYLANRAAAVEAPIGEGRVVLFGIRPQYRGQSNATFKLVFNGLYHGR